MSYIVKDRRVLPPTFAVLSDRKSSRILGTGIPSADNIHEVAQAAATLDFSKPVAVLLIGVLHLVPASADPYGMVATRTSRPGVA